MRLRSYCVALLVSAAPLSPGLAQFDKATGGGKDFPDPVTVSSLVGTSGAPWDQSRSRHFVLYAEQGERPRYKPRALLDSLETAWTNAWRLLGAIPVEGPPITVFVTRFPLRFAGLMNASSRGLTMPWSVAAGAIIILVHNDSSRAFIRHEVMHAVAPRVLGRTAEAWLAEGLATWADGRCGATSIEAVARAELRAEPGLTAPQVARYFDARFRRSLGDRHAAYSIAGSLIASVHERGGPMAVRALWSAASAIREASPLVPDTLTTRWRAYLERTRAGEATLPAMRLATYGCG